MTWTDAISRPRRTLADWLTCTRVAPVATRWRGVAWLQQQCPALFSPPVRRIYQLSYLAAQNQAAFTAACVAGKLSSSCWLGKLEYGEDDLGSAVLSDLTSVYLLHLADSRWTLVLLPTRLGAPHVLPVPRRRLLLLLLWSRKTILH